MPKHVLVVRVTSVTARATLVASENWSRQFEATLVLRVAWVEDWVESQIQHIVKHPWDHVLKQVVALLETRVGIHLNQDQVQVLVKNEVVPKQLKGVVLFD